MGSGRGKSKRAQATLAQRQAAIKKAGMMVRSGKVARAGSSTIGTFGFYTLRKEPIGRNPYSVIESGTQNLVGIFATEQEAQHRIETLNKEDPRTIIQEEKTARKRAARTELDHLERVEF
jgi:hypothetical protein